MSTVPFNDTPLATGTLKIQKKYFLTPNYFFCIFIFYVLTVSLLKGMSESFLLSEDEPLTPNIDGAMAL